MPDVIDAKVSGLWSKFETAVAKGLSEPKVGDYIAFENLVTNDPWRVTRIEWDSTDHLGAKPNDCMVTRARVIHQPAYRVSKTITFTSRVLQNGSDLATAVGCAAGVVGLGFLGKALSLAQLGCVDGGPYSYESVERIIASNPWRWRLIGLNGDDETFKRVKKAGIADVIVLQKIGLAASAQALMVSTQAGPVVAQLDAPVLSWCRTDQGAEVTITRSFLFTGASEGAESRLLGMPGRGPTPGSQ